MPKAIDVLADVDPSTLAWELQSTNESSGVETWKLTAAATEMLVTVDRDPSGDTVFDVFREHVSEMPNVRDRVQELWTARA